MDRLASLNALGVGATVLLAGTAAGLAVVAAASGTAYPIPMLPQWQLLGPTRQQQLSALTGVLPVILACYVGHQSLFPLMPLLQPYSQRRMIQVRNAISRHSRLYDAHAYRMQHTFNQLSVRSTRPRYGLDL